MANGRCILEEMRRLRMQHAEVRTAMRQQGMTDEAALRDVVVERDGTISLIPAGERDAAPDPRP